MIEFSSAYLELPATYLVPAGSPIRSIAEVDKPGVRIAISNRSAYDLYLTRTLKSAQLVRAEGIPASVKLFVDQKLDALAGLKPGLMADAEAPRLTPARRPVHGGPAIDRRAEAARGSREIPARVRRGSEALGPGRAARGEARRQRGERRAAGAVELRSSFRLSTRSVIARTLDHLKAGIEVFERRGWFCELIVCDNNSTDRTGQIARAAGARVVLEPVNQIARARNTGARAACGDWLLFVDADSSPSIDLFQAVLERIDIGGCVGGGCTVTLPGAPLAVRAWVGGWNLTSRMMRWAAGSFLFCEAAAFGAVGGFSEQLYAAEEIDLSRRLKAQFLEREFVILHEHPLATSGRKAELYTWREHLAFMWKMLTAGRRTLRSRDACSVWYDGRR